MAQIQLVTFESAWPDGTTATKLDQWDGVSRTTGSKKVDSYGCNYSLYRSPNYWRFPITGQPYTELELTYWFHPNTNYSGGRQCFMQFELSNGKFAGLGQYGANFRIWVDGSQKHLNTGGCANAWQLLWLHLLCDATSGVIEYTINGGTAISWSGNTLLSSSGVAAWKVNNVENAAINPVVYIDQMSFEVPSTGRVHGPAVQCS